MDPDEALRQIRLLVKQMYAEDGYPMFVQRARDLVEHVEELDKWLSKGGFPPRDWITNDEIEVVPGV